MEEQPPRHHRTKKRALISDEDIESEEKFNNHRRRQRLLDAATWIGIALLYIAALAVILFCAALAYNFFMNDRWDKIEEYTHTIVIALVSFIFGLISTHIIKNSKQ